MANSDEREFESFIRTTVDRELPADVERRLQVHLDELRNCLEADQAGSVAVVAVDASHKNSFWIAVVSVATVAILVTIFVNFTPSTAWADVVKAVQRKPWIRCFGKMPDGTEAEFFFSSRPPAKKNCLTVCFGDVEFASFVDFDKGEVFSYREGENAVRKQPFPRGSAPPLPLVDNFLMAFEPHGEMIGQLNRDSELVEQTQSIVKENDKRWVKYDLKFQEKVSGEQFIDSFFVDPSTRLPAWWIRHSPSSDTSLRFQIEYPRAGPEDIFDLGVPVTTAVIQ